MAVVKETLNLSLTLQKWEDYLYKQMIFEEKVYKKLPGESDEERLLRWFRVCRLEPQMLAIGYKTIDEGDYLRFERIR